MGEVKKKKRKKKQKRLENDYRHFFSAVSSGMSRILIPKGEHTVKVALGTPLSDLIKYLESIRDFLLPRPPFNRARITFWLPCCGFRPRKNYGKEGETIALYKLIGGNTSSGDYYTHTHTRPGACVSREHYRGYSFIGHVWLNVVSFKLRFLPFPLSRGLWTKTKCG